MRAAVNIADEVLRESVRGLLTLSGFEESAGDGLLTLTESASAGDFIPENEEDYLLVFYRADAYLRSPEHRRLTELMGERYSAVRLPYSLAEMLALLTHLGAQSPLGGTIRLGTPAPQPPESASGKESPVISQSDRTVSYRGKSVTLTPREFDLFEILRAADGEPVSRDALLSAVWGREKADTNLTDVYIQYLRRKLDPLFGSGVILSVRGKGYVLRLPEG